MFGQVAKLFRDGTQTRFDNAEGNQVVKMLNVRVQHGKFRFETVILRDVDTDLLSGTDEKQFVGVLGCLAAVRGGGILGGGGGGGGG